MKVIIQLRTSPATHQAAAMAMSDPSINSALENMIQGMSIDASYAPIQLPSMQSTTGAALNSLMQPLEFSMAQATATYLVRGSIPDGSGQSNAVRSALAHPDVVGIYSDPVIESTLTCGGTPPVGDSTKVAQLLSGTKYQAAKRQGKGVYLAIVDTGVNLPYLKAKGINLQVDVAKSWTPAGVATTPGNHPVNHGTMCAFDAAIAAPQATFLDYAVLLSKASGTTVMSGLLSDAVAAYAKLTALLLAAPVARRAMVVTNSWGMFSPQWDFPPGHPGNYSDNPGHPFNQTVAALEAAGADILFAAGNCGTNCPDGRCAFGATPPICGANSHPSVLSIAGVDTTGHRVGYSSQGPGRLNKQKPDVATYTHFKGSLVYPEDSGTSAACPVAAGVLAALRTKYASTKLSPLQLRTLVKKTAIDQGTTGFDYDYGWGILDAGALLKALP